MCWEFQGIRTELELKCQSIALGGLSDWAIWFPFFQMFHSSICCSCFVNLEWDSKKMYFSARTKYSQQGVTCPAGFLNEAIIAPRKSKGASKDMHGIPAEQHGHKISGHFQGKKAREEWITQLLVPIVFFFYFSQAYGTQKAICCSWLPVRRKSDRLTDCPFLLSGIWHCLAATYCSWASWEA